MGIVINTNTTSTMVRRSLSSATSSIQNSLQKLSTGSKINKAADDAAGLTISQGLESQQRGSDVAQSNAQTGINLLQTAEGDLGVIQDNLQRIRDLTVQAANGTNGTSEKAAIQSEVQARVEEIDRLAGASKFSKINLLDGSSTSLTLQIGADSAVSLNTLTIGSPLAKATASVLGMTTALSTAFGTSSAASSFIDQIDTAISTVSTRRSTIGSLQNRLNSAIQSLEVKSENMASSMSIIRDTDVAKEAANMTKNQILQQTSATLLAQANSAPQVALSLI